MKRSLLGFVAVAAVTACFAQAEMFERMDGYCFDKVSPDGSLLSDAREGAVWIYDRTTGQEYAYGTDGMSHYAVGLGNSISRTGMIVGAVSDTQPAYWQNGEWHLLPVKEEDTRTYNGASGVTPDGNRICGTIACADWGLDTEGQMLAPVIWTRGSDGEFGLYEALPQPETDFTGRAPQYVTAISISDDGKTIFGQVVDYSGMYPCMIVYTEGADGWEYKLLGDDLLVNEGAEFPEWPGEYPVAPSASSYMSDEEKAAYDAAMENYQEQVQLFYQGVITEWPEYPVEKDYLTDPDQLAAYEAAYEQYQKDADEYMGKVEPFYEAFDMGCTGVYFQYNSVYGSGNGRYLASIMIAPDPNADPLDWFPSVITVPVIFDMTTGEMKQIEVDDMGATGVLNDGTLLMCSPQMEYARNAFLLPSGEKEAVSLFDWVKGKNEAAYEWMVENLAFDYEGVVYDEDYNESIVTVKDSLISGTVSMNTEGTVFAGYLWDSWEAMSYVSYVVCLDNGSAISRLVAEDVKVYQDPVSGLLNVDGDVRSLSLIDLSGRTVYQSSSDASFVALNNRLPKGTYLVRLLTGNGEVVVKKVFLQ